MKRVGVVVLVVIALVVALFGTEIQLARRGERLDEPDVATLTTVVGSADVTPMRVLWLGDSTAAAVGATSAEHSVSTAVARALVAGRPIAVETRVIAKSGARVNDVLADQTPPVARLRPDVVVISVGANDTIHLTRSGDFRRTYDDVVKALVRAGVPRSRIVLVGVPDMGAPPRLRQPLRAVVGLRGRRLDREVKALARDQKTRYVDLFAGTSSAFRANPDKYFASDRYHPSDAGYALWAEVIAPVLAAD